MQDLIVTVTVDVVVKILQSALNQKQLQITPLISTDIQLQTLNKERPVAKVLPKVILQAREVEKATDTSEIKSDVDQKKKYSGKSSFIIQNIGKEAAAPFVFTDPLVCATSPNETAQKPEYSQGSKSQYSIPVKSVEIAPYQLLQEATEQRISKSEFDPDDQKPVSLLAAESVSEARKMENESHFEPQAFEDPVKVHTDNLEEFLRSLDLTHLENYLRVLGCTCVRDLHLLQLHELESIQLVSRRRLLHHLKQVPTTELHGLPGDMSFGDLLKHYDLDHLQGFLEAIGVLSRADLIYITEDDLQLLKPVTRRRLLALNNRKR